MFEAILAAYSARVDDIAAAITAEMGAPWRFLQSQQAPTGAGHFATMLEVLKTFAFETDQISAQGNTNKVVREAIGVQALITPRTGR